MPFPDPGGPRRTALMPIGSSLGWILTAGAAGGISLVYQAGPGKKGYNQENFNYVNETKNVRSSKESASRALLII